MIPSLRPAARLSRRLEWRRDAKLAGLLMPLAGRDDYDVEPIELPRLLGKIESLLA